MHLGYLTQRGAAGLGTVYGTLHAQCANNPTYSEVFYLLRFGLCLLHSVLKVALTIETWRTKAARPGCMQKVQKQGALRNGLTQVRFVKRLAQVYCVDQDFCQNL